MKNIKILFLAAVMLFSSTACKDEIDELFLNPDASTDAKIEYLWSSMITSGGTALRAGYNPTGFYLLLQGMGPWTQVTTRVNDGQMMNVLSNMSNNNWGNFFTGPGILMSEMQMLYDGLPAEEQAGYDIYFHLAKILRANGAQKILDLYGDMPWTDAFKARSTTDQVLFPAFDTQDVVWKAIIQDLKDAADGIAATTVNTTPGHPHSFLPAQDVLNGGDLQKWINMANSLRLRFAMRLSQVDPGYAGPIIAEMLGKSLVETNDDNIYIDGSDTQGQGNGQLARAVRERQAWTYGSKYMVDIMNAANDPRLEAYFDKTAAGTYVGLPSSPDAQGSLGTIDFDSYSIINTDLVGQNQFIPGPVMTASEVQFIKAEAILRGLATGDAQAAYEAGLRESVDYYYDIFEFNPDASITRPSQADIDAFVTSSTAAYEGTVEQVLTQKWIHFGMIQAHEAWADYRRTGLPNIPDDTSGGTVLERPTRIIYPAAEWVNNEENYEAVRARDLPNVKLWWDVN